MESKAQAPSTLHQQILSDIERNIVSGDWPPGFKLPYEVDLAKSYNVSRMTVNKVLTKLASAGLIERRKRSGSFVMQPQAQSAILEIHDIEAEVVSLGKQYRLEIVGDAVRKTSESDLSLFAVSKKTSVREVTCVHYADDAPFCLEYRLISLKTVPTAQAADFTETPPGKWLRLQVPWSTAEHKIYAIAADADTSKRLGIAEASPCLVVQRRTWGDQGPVTFARFTYPAERHAIVATFTPATKA